MSTMRPSDIYYSQDSISVEFDNGYTIFSTLNACRKHPFVIDKISPIRVCNIYGKWYTLDNRRLWIFKRLEEEGHISDVWVHYVGRHQLPDSKFTTTTEGESVEIRQRSDFFWKKYFRISIDWSVLLPVQLFNSFALWSITVTRDNISNVNSLVGQHFPLSELFITPLCTVFVIIYSKRDFSDCLYFSLEPC